PQRRQLAESGGASRQPRQRHSQFEHLFLSHAQPGKRNESDVRHGQRRRLTKEASLGSGSVEIQSCDQSQRSKEFTDGAAQLSDIRHGEASYYGNSGGGRYLPTLTLTSPALVRRTEAGLVFAQCRSPASRAVR